MNGPPVCQVCGTFKVWREAGVNRSTGAAYEAFWACPNYKSHPPQGQPPTSYVQPAAPQAPQPAPGPVRPSAPTLSPEGLSIAAQACAKAAAHSYSGIAAGWSAQQIEDGVYGLAVRLFAHLVAPAGRGQAPTPAGFVGGTQPDERNPPDDSDIPF